MKMFGKKSISTVLYYIFGSLFVCLVVYFSYLLFSILFGNYITAEYLNYTSYKVKALFDGDSFSYVSIRMDISGIISCLFFFIKNGLFLYLLIFVFKNFKREDFLFTKEALKSLKVFAILNICMPFVYAFFDILMFHQLVFENIKGGFFNLFLGLLTLFVLAIFTQGYKIQQENDLTI